MSEISEATIGAQLARLGELRAAIATAIVGQDAVVEQLLIGLLAGGHCMHSTSSFGACSSLPT
jgi:MoxR-like ATPase